MLSTTDFRRGLKIEIEGVPYEVLDFLHVKPGKGGAFVRTKLKNLLTGSIVDETFRAGEKFDRPDLETRSYQYLYKEGDSYVFMDMTTYEQINVAAESFADKGQFLKEGEEVKVLVYRNQPIDLDLPASVVLEVVETEPGVKGDTVSGATKPATLETGLVVQVPLFINEGDKIKIDTRTKEYIGRE
ncbi:MAG: elongation factor [Desulfonauticus sp.]|jgi:elongation factor P|nr:MAG: Elongation factor P [Desulfonauticus sp. 38_4375]MDK2920739.1 elongation factor [Desulfonauticus sp.]